MVVGPLADPVVADPVVADLLKLLKERELRLLHVITRVQAEVDRVRAAQAQAHIEYRGGRGR